MTNNTHNAKSQGFLGGRFVITATALRRVNLQDAYHAVFCHARAQHIEHSPDHKPKIPGKARLRRMTTHLDRHGTAFWIITEATLARTKILLPEDFHELRLSASGLCRKMRPTGEPTRR